MHDVTCIVVKSQSYFYIFLLFHDIFMIYLTKKIDFFIVNYLFAKVNDNKQI